MTVAQTAEFTGITAHSLRYYERIGLIHVARNTRGHRVYCPDTVGRAVFISRMRSSGMSIENLQRYVALIDDGIATDQRRELLESHRRELATKIAHLQISLALTDFKIDHYQQVTQCAGAVNSGGGAAS